MQNLSSSNQQEGNPSREISGNIYTSAILFKQGPPAWRTRAYRVEKSLALKDWRTCRGHALKHFDQSVCPTKQRSLVSKARPGLEVASLVQAHAVSGRFLSNHCTSTSQLASLSPPSLAHLASAAPCKQLVFWFVLCSAISLWVVWEQLHGGRGTQEGGWRQVC
jgi:hypothetical protein